MLPKLTVKSAYVFTKPLGHYTEISKLLRVYTNYFLKQQFKILTNFRNKLPLETILFEQKPNLPQLT